MLCQNCGKNEANVRYTQIVNGAKKEMFLCEDCAKKLGIGNFKMRMPLHFSNLLGNLFEDYDEGLLPNFIKENSRECDSCGTLYDDFIKTGLLGCADCYDMFEDRLDHILKNIQGNTKHIGRKPLNINEKMKNIGENYSKVNKADEKVSEKESAGSKNNSENNKESNKQEKIQELNKELNKAIEEERYEDAAKIRDKIKQIKDEK